MTKKRRPASPYDIAIEDTDDRRGRRLPIPPDNVRAAVERLMKEGNLIAVVAQNGKDVGVQVFGQPSKEIADVLDQAARGYRIALEGH